MIDPYQSCLFDKVKIAVYNKAQVIDCNKAKNNEGFSKSKVNNFHAISLQKPPADQGIKNWNRN